MYVQYVYISNTNHPENVISVVDWCAAQGIGELIN